MNSHQSKAVVVLADDGSVQQEFPSQPSAAETLQSKTSLVPNYVREDMPRANGLRLQSQNVNDVYPMTAAEKKSIGMPNNMTSALVGSLNDAMHSGDARSRRNASLRKKSSRSSIACGHGTRSDTITTT